MNKSITATVGSNVRGIVQCHIVDAKTKKVLRTFPKQNNLILNQYLNNWAGRIFGTGGWQQGFYYACAGDGTTPTQQDSGLTTATQAGTTVTLAGGAFVFTDTATDSGKVIKWDTNEEAMIVSVTSPTQVEVNVTQAVPAAEFTVYLCNQTKMGGGIGGAAGTSDIKRTSTWVSGVGDCGTTWVSPHIAEMKRTYDFTPEVGPVTYYEIGMSNSATVDSATLNVRVLLGVPVALIAGQQLRVVYTLIVTFSPSAATPIVADIPGWPVAPATDTNATLGIEYLNIQEVTTTGSPSGLSVTGCEPGQFESCYLTPYAGAVAAVPIHVPNNAEDVNEAKVGPAYAAYVSQSFECFTNCVFTPAIGNRTDHRSIFIGYRVGGFGANPDPSHLRIRFDQAQTKDSLHKLTVRWRWVASRTLS